MSVVFHESVPNILTFFWIAITLMAIDVFPDRLEFSFDAKISDSSDRTILPGGVIHKKIGLSAV